MPEAVANLIPSGSGRFTDFVFPSRLTALGAAVPDGSMSARHGQQSLTGSATIGYGGGTTPSWTVQNGVPCVKMTGTAVGAGVGIALVPPASMTYPTTRNAILAKPSSQAVYRLIWLFAGNGDNVGNNTDFALEISHNSGLNQRVFVDLVDGFGVAVIDANTLGWFARGPNGLQRLNLTAAPFDTSAWHSVDLRIFGATAIADASLELRIDDTIVNLGAANTSWAAGTNLPAQGLSGGGQIGFRPLLVSVSGAQASALYTHSFRFIAANSAAMTL